MIEGGGGGGMEVRVQIRDSNIMHEEDPDASGIMMFRGSSCFGDHDARGS